MPDFREWEPFREYLQLIARLQVPRALQGKVDVSGMVQQTLLEAHRAKQKPDEDKALAWLRTILANNLRDELRRWQAEARNVERERSLEAALAASSQNLEEALARSGSSPSRRAIRHENLLALAQALANLPDDQRRAVELHHLQALPLKDVAEQLHRSPGAVAALLFRALKQMRTVLAAQWEGEAPAEP